MMEALYGIEETAARVGLSQKRIREYERAGLLKPARQLNTNNRLFTEAEITRIKRIKYLIHKKGITVSSIQQFMVKAPCWEIFACRNKAECAAYQGYPEPCWKVNRDNGRPEPESVLQECSRCPVFLCRDQKKFPLFLKEQPNA